MAGAAVAFAEVARRHVALHGADGRRQSRTNAGLVCHLGFVEHVDAVHRAGGGAAAAQLAARTPRAHTPRRRLRAAAGGGGGLSCIVRRGGYQIC
eukprot:659951-Prorocentrum_minimum.AAC.2